MLERIIYSNIMRHSNINTKLYTKIYSDLAFPPSFKKETLYTLFIHTIKLQYYNTDNYFPVSVICTQCVERVMNLKLFANIADLHSCIIGMQCVQSAVCLKPSVCTVSPCHGAWLKYLLPRR